MAASALSFPDVAVYLLVAVMVFRDGTALLRFAVPGELAAAFGGMMASTSMTLGFDISQARMSAVVLVSALIGDGMAHHAGHHAGTSALGYRVLVVRRERLLIANRNLARRPRLTMTLGRFTPFGRRVLPTLAGAAGVAYRRFLPWNALGCAVWGCAFVAAGNQFGHLGRGLVQAVVAAFLLAGVVLALLGAAVWRLKSVARRGE